jgi:dihydropteroate synthase
LYVRPIIEDDSRALDHWRDEIGDYPGHDVRMNIDAGPSYYLCEVLVRDFPTKRVDNRIWPRDLLETRYPDQVDRLRYLERNFEDGRSVAGVPTGGTPLVMGILNATPDSFSDGGAFDHIVGDRVRALAGEGATIIDIGGESTRPDADDVELEEEWSRVAPALDAASETDAIVSIDTRKAEVARRALDKGARIFNDVSALTYDPDSVRVACAYAEAGGSICLMHASGDPKTMQTKLHYDNVLLDIFDYLERRMRVCEDAGINRRALIVDPGIGFGKTLDHNITLLKNLTLFHGLGCPTLLGASRKGFIGTLSGEKEAAKRGPGSIAVALHGARQGMNILRVHDVRETVQAMAVDAAIRGG